MTQTVRNIAGAAPTILEAATVRPSALQSLNVRDARYVLKALFGEEASQTAMLRATKAAMLDDHADAAFWIDVYLALQQPSEDD